MSHVTVKKLNGVVILTPKGQLTGGEETIELENLIRDLATDGNSQLIIDLGQTEFINSWALGVLIGGHVNYSKRQGKVKLSNIGDRISSILQITKLVRIFDVYETTDKAIASFARD